MMSMSVLTSDILKRYFVQIIIKLDIVSSLVK